MKSRTMFRCFLLLITAYLTSACSIQKLDKNEVNAVELVQVSQRVVRYDCNGIVATDRVEVTSKPEQWVAVDPDAGFEPVSSSFYNKTTRTRSIVTQHSNFLVQYGTRDFGMFVNRGLNEIEYKFYSCADPRTSQCPESQHVLAETGVLKLNVSYREEFKHDVLRVSASGCQ